MARSPIEELQRQIAKLREQVEQLLNGPVEPRTTSADARAARELEDISIVLADRASSLEAIIVEERAPHGGSLGGNRSGWLSISLSGSIRKFR